MAFPYYNEPPKRDIRNVRVDIVRCKGKVEMTRLLSFLSQEGVENVYQIEPDDNYHTIAVSLLSDANQHFGFIGVHVQADLAYHGARIFACVEDFINARLEQRLS